MGYKQPNSWCLALQLKGRGGSWAWWGKPIISAMAAEAGRYTFKACLGYIVSSRLENGVVYGSAVEGLNCMQEALGSTPSTLSPGQKKKSLVDRKPTPWAPEEIKEITRLSRQDDDLAIGPLSLPLC